MLHLERDDNGGITLTSVASRTLVCVAILSRPSLATGTRGVARGLRTIECGDDSVVQPWRDSGSKDMFECGPIGLCQLPRAAQLPRTMVHNELPCGVVVGIALGNTARDLSRCQLVPGQLGFDIVIGVTLGLDSIVQSAGITSFGSVGWRRLGIESG